MTFVARNLENIRCDCMQASCAYCGRKFDNMSEKKINLGEIINKELSNRALDILNGNYRSMHEGTVSAMKEAIKQALELAAENVKLLEDGKSIGDEFLMEAYNTYYTDVLYTIDKQSILNVINLIE